MTEDKLENLSVKELLNLADTTLDQLVIACADPIKKHLVELRHEDLKMIYKAIGDKERDAQK